ncbi:hypothetical protein YenMTG1_241 [Yersinia phage vB_YenM_TG1]|uniref:Uncharacterized protein n=1 Tax=Yersinia phage vB_YenM_TG1 TaxID=1589265 RepID=A0A0B5A4Q1_9CAUD|nr:hypothetical protein AVV33_gp154 [Yersinia phage vB_YenM_TG1]AJD82051.1 hypothetical protein YenMTG1_241 [Yersinia phage vB_YenM_TG1]
MTTTTQIAKISDLFVAWLGDFETDAKQYGLSISDTKHEIGGYLVTLIGDKTQLLAYLNNEYVIGANTDEAAEILDMVEDA